MPDPTMQRLRDVTAAALAGEPVPADLAGWLAAAVTRYEAGAGTIALDQALGLGLPGPRGWWTREALEARDAALVAIRRQHFPTLSAREAATRIVSLARRGSALVAEAARHGGIPSEDRVRKVLGASETRPKP